MLLLCKKCAYPNLPTSSICSRCGNVTQSDGELAKSTQFWNDLPPQVRSEFEQKYQREQQKHNRYLAFLKRNLVKHILLGALINCVFSFFTYLYNMPMPWLIIYLILTLITGGITGWLLNLKGGGRFTGVIIFPVAYFIPLFINGIHLLLVVPEEMHPAILIWWIFQAGIGFMLSVCAGYFIGFKLEMDRFDQWS